MAPHKIPPQGIPGTPIIYRPFDHWYGRLPKIQIRATAGEKQFNNLTDCPDCTIIMRYAQYKTDVLGNLAAEFNAGPLSKRRVLDVWFTFNKFLGYLPILVKKGKDKAAARKPEELTEKEYSEAWVRVLTIVSSSASLMGPQLRVDQQHELCPGHFLHLSENKNEKTDSDRYKIDGAFIALKDRDEVVPDAPNWVLQRMGAELGGKTNSDSYDDGSNYDWDPDWDAPTHKVGGGQVISCNKHNFAYQHRTAMYRLFIDGECFRAMRWDRAGVIVTEAINYVRSPAGTKALLEVLYAFSRLTLEQKGYDLTVVPLLKNSCGWQRMNKLGENCDDDLNHQEGPITKPVHPVFIDPSAPLPAYELSAEEDRLHHDPTCVCEDHLLHALPVLPVWEIIRRMFRDTLVEGFPRYRIRLGGEDYLIAKHIFLASTMVGRGTRGYIALEWRTQRLVFLKDVWRPHFPGVPSEGEILSELNANDVPYIPQLIHYEDVCYEDGTPQETETSKYSPSTGSKRVEPGPPFLPAISEWQQVATEDPTVKDSEAATAFLRQFPDSAPSKLQHIMTESEAIVPPPACISAPTGDGTIVIPAVRSESTRGTKRTADDVAAEDRRIQGTGLRHLVHSRIVTRDICLPFMEFTNSRQLVQIVLECIVGQC